MQYDQQGITATDTTTKWIHKLRLHFKRQTFPFSPQTLPPLKTLWSNWSNSQPPLHPCISLSPPAAWGRRAGVPSQEGPWPCRKSLLRPDCRGPSLPSFPRHLPLLCKLLEGANVGSGLVQEEERAVESVEEMEVGWDRVRVRERGGPAPGPGWKMTPACRLDAQEFPVLLE